MPNFPSKEYIYSPAPDKVPMQYKSSLGIYWPIPSRFFFSRHASCKDQRYFFGLAVRCPLCAVNNSVFIQAYLVPISHIIIIDSWMPSFQHFSAQTGSRSYQPLSRVSKFALNRSGLVDWWKCSTENLSGFSSWKLDSPISSKWLLTSTRQTQPLVYISHDYLPDFKAAVPLQTGGHLPEIYLARDCILAVMKKERSTWCK